LPPVQQGCEFDSLDTAGDSETKEQPIEMSFHGTPCHIELAGDFGVIASLQQQVYDLLFARTEPNSLLFHSILPFFGFAAPEKGARLISSSHSIHVAISGANARENRKTIFHRHLQPKRMLRKSESALSWQWKRAHRRDHGGKTAPKHTSARVELQLNKGEESRFGGSRTRPANP